MSATLRGRRAAIVFMCFGAGYFLSFVLRSINAVIAPTLMSDLGLSNADLGLLSAAYFITFALLQLPLGIWLDKYGARRTEAALLLVAALGAAVFASSSSLTGLWVGRALIGIGVSACLMAAFKAYRQWFEIKQQAQLASWMLVAGTSGAVMSTLPVTMALPYIGWRGLFVVLAVLLALVAALIFFVLRDVEREFRERAAQLPAQDADDGGYRRIFTDPYFWRLAIVGLLFQGSFTALQSLWIGPWMTVVLGKTPQQAGEILFYFNLSVLLAYLALGWAVPRLNARGLGTHKMIGVGLVCALLVEATFILIEGSQAWMLWLLLGPCIAVAALVQAHVGLAFPASLAGRANTAYNLHLFVGAFGAQWGIGVMIDAFKAYGLSAPAAFKGALVVIVIVQLVALAQFVLRRVQPRVLHC
jgi:predicted MFS family arabinose efflux permease